MGDRVIVVTHEASGQLLKVCASWDDFDSWIDRNDWEKHEVKSLDAAVYEAPTDERPYHY